MVCKVRHTVGFAFNEIRRPYTRLRSHDRVGDDALVGAVLPLTSAAARKDARAGGRGLLLYA